VILDWIFNNKPFLLLGFGKWNTNEYLYIDEEYAENIFSLAKLDEIISHRA